MTVATIACQGDNHTLRYDGELVLVDHDLERDLAFQALRDDPPEGCLAVLEAWHGIRRDEASREFLEAMLLEDVDVRSRYVTQLTRRLAYDLAESGQKARIQYEVRLRWELALIALPHPLRLAHCRSLGPKLTELDDHQLRVALIGEERWAEVVPFPQARVRPPKH